jgi:hypothetical protein
MTAFRAAYWRHRRYWGRIESLRRALADITG